MPLAEYLDGQKSPQPPAAATNSTAKLRKQVFLQVGLVIAMGLLLAGWYVGYRVYAARSAQPPVPVKVIQEVPKKVVVAPQPAPPPIESKPIELPAPVAPVVPGVKPDLPAISNQKPETSNLKPTSSRQPRANNFTRHEASPRTGERYLQIAAFGPKALDGFLKTLEGQGLHPLVAPGPVDNIYRILVGPFPNSTALEEARSLIKTSGVEPILRTY
jgi:outer membrane biosynthesis protein TonB